MVIKQPIKRILILCLLLSLVLLCGHIHHEPREDGAEHYCWLCTLINTGFILTTVVCFELYYIILGIIAFIDGPVIVSQTYLIYLMRGPPIHSTGS